MQFCKKIKKSLYTYTYSSIAFIDYSFCMYFLCLNVLPKIKRFVFYFFSLEYILILFFYISSLVYSKTLWKCLMVLFFLRFVEHSNTRQKPRKNKNYTVVMFFDFSDRVKRIIHQIFFCFLVFYDIEDVDGNDRYSLGSKRKGRKKKQLVQKCMYNY